ncbi:MAG: DUF2474 domain-containing protein [Henriciella sp.]|nr:DUF2474 domain-containing protein [Henriciella sp.]MBO6695713.1 DUF2474 domain-containing protein [Henriciella sp.]
MREELRTPIKKTGLKEIAWFVGLWALGVAVILIVGGLIKLVL